MPAIIDKHRVARAFLKNHDTYDAHAIVQHTMAEDLIASLRAKGPRAFGRVLELGCGTGLLTRKLLAHFRTGTLYLNDLSPELTRDTAAMAAMMGACRVTPCPGDMEALDPLPGQLDLVLSGAAFQWLHDCAAFLKRAGAALTPGGLLAFTTFGPDNCREVRAVTGHGLDYPTLHRLRRFLEPDFQVLVARQSLATLHFDTPLAVLRHLRQTGVNSLATACWTPRDLHRFCDAYPAEGGGHVALTYHPIRMVARKR